MAHPPAPQLNATQTPVPTRPSVGMSWGVLVAFGVGVLLAMQSQFNANLSQLGAGFLWAGWASYTGTLAALVLIVVVRRRTVWTWTTMRTRSAWWWYAIGWCSIPIVLGLAWGVPILGVSLASVCALVGQTVSGMAFDARGIGVMAPIPISGRRMVAAICAVAGLVGAMLLGPGGVTGSPLAVLVIALVLVLGGMVLNIQQSGNGRITQMTGDPVIPAITCVVGGWSGVMLLGLIGWGVFHQEVHWPSPIEHPTAYLGGLLGAIITVGSAWSIQHLGALTLTMAVVGGQLVAAFVLDMVTGVGWSLATLVAVVGVCLATYLTVSTGRRRSAPASPS